MGTKTIALFLAATANPKLVGVTPLEQAEVDQWITYCNTTIKPTFQAKNLKAVRELSKVRGPYLFYSSHQPSID